MHISLDQAIGRQPRLNRVGQSLLNIGSGASAAYSLRSLTGGDPKVVNVRRDADNEERKFTSTEVGNELADWTNGKQETTLPADVATSAAAYSLRKVKSDYTGPAVRIRRTSDDIDADVAFDTNDTVSNDSIVTEVLSGNQSTLQAFISGTNAAVAIWYDQSGNSNNATQTTDANQPLIAESGNLKDHLDFDGTDDLLNVDSQISIANEHSLFLVASTSQTSAGGGGDFPNLLGDNTSGKGIGFFAGKLLNKAAGSNNSDGLFSFTSDTSKKILSTLSNGTNINSFHNGAASSDNPISDDGTDNKFDQIGGSTQTNDNFDGNVFEIIIFTSDQTNNRFKIESNINNHYGILDGTSLSSSTAFFLDGTTGSPSSFTADGLDGFTMIMGGAGNVRAGIELQNKVPSGKHVVVSFDADLTLGTGTATPIIKLMKTSLSGTGAGNNFDITQGRNTISLNSNDNDAKFVLFLEGNTNVGYSISNFTMSLRDENGFVNKWLDQSGNSNDATADADEKEPKIVSAGSYLGELEFDGSNDVLEFTTAEVAASDKISVFMTLTGPSSGDRSLMGSSIAFPIRRFSGSNKLASLTNTGLHRLDSTSTFTDTNTGIITLIRDLDVPSGLLAVDGTVEDTVSTSYGLSSTYQIGAKLSGSSNGRFADIKCKEMIVYATNQTTNRTTIETNIANEYGITLS